ncbi:hypothetical protein ACIBFB_19145 [Nocardiopsis sp. NPDC050513]|uniref:hypothetical protein n=1 Tax=Nocardiopsis sp. NPDC050513 TaxID=3364338 RepID=UPI0037928448
MVRFTTAAATGLAACALTLSIATPAQAAEGTLTFEVIDWSQLKTNEHVITDAKPGSCHNLPEEVLEEAKNTEFHRFTNNTESPVILIRNSCDQFETNGRAQAVEFVSAGDTIRELDPAVKALLVLQNPADAAEAAEAAETGDTIQVTPNEAAPAEAGEATPAKPGKPGKPADAAEAAQPAEAAEAAPAENAEAAPAEAAEAAPGQSPAAPADAAPMGRR